MGTKENIINSSLDLFSTGGYEAVSMREIARKVGIRESSIYKHFKGKHEILDGIVIQCKEKIEQIFMKLNVPGGVYGTDMKIYGEMTVEEVAKLCCKVFFAQLHDEEIVKFKRLLTIEQYKNEELGNIYREIFIERPITYQKKVFEFLIKTGFFYDADSEILVLEFFSPFFMIQHRYVDDIEKQKDLLMKHTKYFLTTHIKEEFK